MNIKPTYDNLKLKEAQSILFDEFYATLISFDEDLNNITLKDVPKKNIDMFFTAYNKLKEQAEVMKKLCDQIYQKQEDEIEELKYRP